MPDYNPAVPNGIDSVSTGKVFLKEWLNKLYPACINHGALLKVSKDGIWRCGEIHCSNGCYELK